AREVPLLRALGMRDRDLTVVVLGRALAIALVAVLIAVLVAVFGSQLALLGLARDAELHPGPHVDWPVLILGSAALLALALGVSYAAGKVAQRETRRQVGGVDRTPEAVHGPRIAGAGSVELPVVTALGVRFALQRGRAPRAAPAWTAILGAALTVAMLASAFTFVGNLRRELGEAERYGWNWDIKLGSPALPDLSNVFTPVLRRDPTVAAMSVGTVTQIDVGAAHLDVLGVDNVVGSALPTFVHGRPPRNASEMVLGARSMRDLHTHIGATLDARIGTRRAQYRIVGQAVFPEFGDSGQLGTGAFTTYAGLTRLLPDAPRNSYFVRLHPQYD